MINFYEETIDFLSKNHKLASDVISVEMSCENEDGDGNIKITTYSSNWKSFAKAAKTIEYDNSVSGDVITVINPSLKIIGKGWTACRTRTLFEDLNKYTWILYETESIKDNFADVDLINPDFIRDLNQESHKYLKFTEGYYEN